MGTPVSADQFEELVDAVAESLIWSTADDSVQAEISAALHLEGLYIDQQPPGLIVTDDEVFFHPRLALYLDAFAGEYLYGFAKFQFDRGFDPGSEKDGDARVDEYALRATGAGHSVQVGQFATRFGAWVLRHEPWDNPFLNAPVPYENVTILFDRTVFPDADTWLRARNRPDVKAAWLPVIWGPVYTTGASAFGTLQDVDYAFSVKNRALSSRSEVWDEVDFNDPSYTARFGYRRSETWAFGLSGSIGPYLQENVTGPLPEGSDSQDFDQRALGLDTSWAHGHWQFWSEVIYSDFEVPNVDRVDTTSYFMEARYKWSPRWYTAMRWNQQFFSKVDLSNGDSIDWDRDISKIDAAAGYHVNRKLLLKVQYSYADQEGSLEQGEQFAGVQLTLKM
jgi:hypothetical protein